MSLCSGCVAELNIGVSLCCFDHVAFVVEAVRKNNIASAVNEVKRLIVAFLTFRNVCLDDIFDFHFIASFFEAVDEVEVVC